jgi:ceramide glucosyltransferase
LKLVEYGLLILGAVPFVYYYLAIFSAAHYFLLARKYSLQARKYSLQNPDFTPPISNLKPVRGADPEGYENFASLCRQDYPEYELIFCTTDQSDPSVPVIQRLMREFPERKIRLLFSAGHTAINDKVAKLGLMVKEAQYEHLVFNDSDVRVEPDYLRKMIGPLRDKKVGGVTCFYVSSEDKSIVECLQTMGMISDFYAGILVAWQLDGVHFALGPSMASTKERVRRFGGFQVLEGRPADDLLFGRLIAEQGAEVRLLPYAVKTVPDFKGIDGLFSKRVRWMTVMRKMRRRGHFGLLFTWGLPWATVAVAAHPTLAVAAAYWGGYLACRVLITWLIGVYGLKQSTLWKKMPLIPVWDALALLVWLTSFMKKSIRWRGVDYQLESGTGHFVIPDDRSASHVSTRADS